MNIIEALKLAEANDELVSAVDSRWKVVVDGDAATEYAVEFWGPMSRPAHPPFQVVVGDFRILRKQEVKFDDIAKAIEARAAKQ